MEVGEGIGIAFADRVPLCYFQASSETLEEAVNRMHETNMERTMAAMRAKIMGR